MAKAPAFQFYVKDWLSDPALQVASASTRGIWIQALSLMWCADDKGILVGEVQAMPRVLNCTKEEFDLFIKESSVTKFADVTISNGVVTMKNRRMVRDEKTRASTRARVKKHRGKEASNTTCNGECNDEITVPSSSPSSSSHKEYPKKNFGVSDSQENESSTSISSQQAVNNQPLPEEPKPFTKRTPDMEPYLRLSENILLEQHRQHPTLLKEKAITKAKIKSGAEALEKLVRLDSYDLEQEVKPALRWAVRDEFWSRQVLGAAGLRNKGKNGNTKFQNILAAMEKSGGAPPPKDTRTEEQRLAEMAEHARKHHEKLAKKLGLADVPFPPPKPKEWPLCPPPTS